MPWFSWNWVPTPQECQPLADELSNLRDLKQLWQDELQDGSNKGQAGSEIKKLNAEISQKERELFWCIERYLLSWLKSLGRR